ncbi:hypothetical protein D3C81_1435470 [compost metagenome]
MADCVARGNSAFVDSMLSRICRMASAITCVVSTCSREARAICPISSSDSPDDCSIWLSEACTLSTLRAASVTPAASELMPRAAFSDCSLISRTMTLISSEASLVRCANCRTSPATTAKPRPCSPARAASMAAFSASKLVRAEISEMASVKPVMRLDFSCRLSMVLDAPCASSRAVLMRRKPWSTSARAATLSTRTPAATLAARSALAAIFSVIAAFCTELSAMSLAVRTSSSTFCLTESTKYEVSAAPIMMASMALPTVSANWCKPGSPRGRPANASSAAPMAAATQAIK